MRDIHEDVEPLPRGLSVTAHPQEETKEGTTTRGELTNRRGSSPRSLMHTHARHGIREAPPSLPLSSLSAPLPLPIVFAPSQPSPSGEHESRWAQKSAVG